MLVQSDGNVGIGTTSPNHKLHVSGNASVTNMYLATNIIHDGDTNTLIGFETDVIKLTTAGNERLRVTNVGRVGIGTTGPAYKLDVNAGTDNQSALFRSTDASNAIGLTDSGTTLPTSVGMGVVGNDMFLYAGSTAYQQRLRIQGSTGNVGIGTTSPRSKLEVKGAGGNTSGIIVSNANDIIRHYFNGNALGSTYAITYDGTGGNDFQIQSDGDIILADNTGGNVGIGTTTPASKLDVNGGIRMADDTATASATNVGTLRYRTSGNNSYVDMCMQTGASTYAWVNIVQNNW